MKFLIYMKLSAPTGKTVEVPNTGNPVECDNLASLLPHLANNLPALNFGLEFVGIRVEKVQEPTPGVVQ